MIGGDWSVGVSIGVFVACALAILWIGTKLSAIADQLADRTGWGESFVGAVLLGGSTSLPGITASVTAAADGLPAMALANAFGGIAAQTAFLAIADITYPKVNLEHAAASLENMMQGALLIALLSVLMVAMTGPQVSVWGVHPASVVLLVGYVLALRMIQLSRGTPGWRLMMTRETKPDVPEEPEPGQTLAKLWMKFAGAAAVVVVAGWALTRASAQMAEAFNWSQTFVGSLFTAVATSLPELVTSIAAVRRGAVTLAVGGIIGGNAFDTLFAAMADVAYREGSIYGAATDGERLLVSIAVLMTSVLLLGLLRREKRGVANIGFESFIVLLLYGAWIVLQVFTG